MPVYTYRREDGTTFEVKQKFTDDPLVIDPDSGQRVQRVVQAAGVIFKGQGFYVNDSKSASKRSANGVSKTTETVDSKTEAVPAKDTTSSSTTTSTPAPAAPASAAS